METDSFSSNKRFLHIGALKIAYYEEGKGDPILFLHGCPFSSFVWRKVIRILSPHYRCLAPDLLGLGDTETSSEANWSLPSQADMIIRFLDSLGIERTHVIAHDHGGAVAQLLAAECPDRIDRLVLSNAEAYDNWPSAEERPFAVATQLPVVGNLLIWLYSRKTIFKYTLVEAKAVKNPAVLTDELLNGYLRANLSTRHKRKKTRRFIAGQFDRENNNTTMKLLNGLRKFSRPTMLLWGADDVHFGPEWAERLAHDIPGAVRLESISPAGHLVMEEAPEVYAQKVRIFLAEEAAALR